MGKKTELLGDKTIQVLCKFDNWLTISLENCFPESKKVIIKALAQVVFICLLSLFGRCKK